MKGAHNALAERFEAHRDRLRAVAYRLLGSLTDAEDAVQEAWLRLIRVDSREVGNLGGWLTTVVSRVCLDMLRTRKSRREADADPPDTLAGGQQESDPEYEAMLADSVGLALLVVLGNLKPAERVSFVLHDIFALPFGEIAPIVGKSEAAVRQLASRARQRVRGAEKRPADTDLARQRELVDAFLAAARAGDFAGLVAALDPDVEVRDDRPADVAVCARGADALAKQISGRAQAAEAALVNGSAGAIVAPLGKLLYVLRFTIRNGKIAEVDLISDPARIRNLELAVWSD